MNEELKNALEAFKTEVKGKTSEEVKGAIETLEAKYKETLANEVKAAKDEFAAQLKQVQDHADKLDVKLQEKSKKDLNALPYKEAMSKSIEDNFDKIKEVSVGQKVSFEVKAVADMTTTNNLTGSVIETIQNGVAADPFQKVNFADLVPTVQSATGVYVIYRETGQEGAIAAKTEGAAGSQIDFDYTKVTFNASNIFGYSRVSSEMLNDLPFLSSALPSALRREYFKVENSTFYTSLAAAATASTEIITGKNKVEMLINDIAKIEEADYDANGIVLTVADWYDILKTEKSTGAGYGLPISVTFENGVLRLNGIPVFKANWIAANKYFVGDWSQAKKISVSGLQVDLFEQDSDNVTKDLVTARVKQRTVLGIDRPDAFIFGDFTAV